MGRQKGYALAAYLGFLVMTVVAIFIEQPIWPMLTIVSVYHAAYLIMDHHEGNG